MNGKELFKINIQRVTEKIIKFIKETVEKAGFKKVAVAVSGGIDSAVSFSLAIKALGKENVFCLLLPCGELNREDLKDVKMLCRHLDFPQDNVFLINIQPAVDVFLKLKKDLTMDKIRLGNIMARVRMIVLFDLAKKHRALVLGTENKTEHLLGYFTRFGDAASDLEPLVGLYKTQIRQLGEFLKIPEKIIRKTPTAGLWPGQTDKDELGFSYKIADQILYFLYDKKYSVDKIVKMGLEEEVVRKVERRMKENEFKHKTPVCLAKAV